MEHNDFIDSQKIKAQNNTETLRKPQVTNKKIVGGKLQIIAVTTDIR